MMRKGHSVMSWRQFRGHGVSDLLVHQQVKRSTKRLVAVYSLAPEGVR